MQLNALSNPGGHLMSTQISRMLINELKEGAFQKSDRLPSEIELSEKLGVSRTVIRDALSDLEREGLIERVRGIGTVINRDIVNLKSRLDLKFEYNDLILETGHKPATDSIRLQLAKADADCAQKLHIQTGDPLIKREKRVLANQLPVIYSIDYLPLSLFDGMNYNDIDWSKPIFDILNSYCGLDVISDITSVSAVTASGEISKKLLVSPGDALILLDETGFCRLSRPVMRSFEYYTNFFQFSLLRKKF